MKSNLAAAMTCILGGGLTTAMESSLRHNNGQPTINGGRKMFKQNRRQPTINGGRKMFKQNRRQQIKRNR